MPSSINYNPRSITYTQYCILRGHLITNAFLKHKLPTHIDTFMLPYMLHSITQTEGRTFTYLQLSNW